ncbi:MAG TPA: hypothetical protein VHU84_10675, partial [Lacipirellulaceae bacterium]|nr:hypothetical protein [Lacipirellulaceae bacterium]
NCSWDRDVFDVLMGATVLVAHGYNTIRRHRSLTHQAQAPEVTYFWLPASVTPQQATNGGLKTTPT